MLLWGYRGGLDELDLLSFDEAHALLSSARPAGDISPERRTRILEERLHSLDAPRPSFDKLAEQRWTHLVEAHERFSALVEQKRFGVV